MAFHKIAIGVILALALSTAALQGVAAGASATSAPSAQAQDAAQGSLYPRLDGRQGEQKVLVLLVEFPDLAHNLMISSIRNEFSRVASYFYTVSYGEIYLTVNVSQRWYVANRSIGDYLSGGDAYNALRAFAEEAVAMADGDVDFSAYDSVVILHAGSSAQFGGSSYTLDGLGIETGDGATLECVMIDAEYDQWVLIAHEYCHALGLPDLYDYASYSSGSYSSFYAGPWDIMSNDYRYEESALTSWNLIRLGWMPDRSVRTVMPSETAACNVNELGKLSGSRYGAIRIQLNDGTYYLVECRLPVRYDVKMPDFGVLITHVNESIEPGYGPLRVIDSTPSTGTLDDAVFDLRAGKTAVFLDEENDVSVVVLRLLSANGLGFAIEVTDYANGQLALETAQFLLDAKDRVTSRFYVLDVFGERAAVEEAFGTYATGDFQGAYKQAQDAIGIYWLDVSIRIAVAVALVAAVVLVAVFRKKVRELRRRIDKKIDPLKYPETLPDGRADLR